MDGPLPTNVCLAIPSFTKSLTSKSTIWYAVRTTVHGIWTGWNPGLKQSSAIGEMHEYPSGHGPDHDHWKPPTFSYFWVHFRSKIFCILFSVPDLVHPKMGLVWYHGNQKKKKKKAQMKNTTLMTQQTAKGLKVLKNWYWRSGP